jgi:hypothetical protein
MALHGAALAAWKRKHPALVRRWGRSKPKRRGARRHHVKHTHKEHKMAKRKNRRGTRKSRRRGGSRGGGLFSLSKRDMQMSAAVAGLYTFLQYKNKQQTMDWFMKIPTVTAVGKAGTIAGLAAMAYFGGVARKWTKPLAIGTAAVALVQLGQRGFQPYTDAHDAQLAGDGGSYLEGDVDLVDDIADAA